MAAFLMRFNSRFRGDSPYFIRIVHYHIDETSLRRVAVVYRDSPLFPAIAIESRSRWHEFWRKLRNCTSGAESSGQAYLARQWPFFSAFYPRDKNSFITLLLKSVNPLKRRYVDSADEKAGTGGFFPTDTSSTFRI